MTRPTSSIRFIASSFLRAERARRQPMPEGFTEATGNQARPKCVLLHDIPRTALPSDIARALRDVGAVDESFSVSSITSLPPSLPKAPSLHRTFHLSLPSAKKAQSILTTLSTKPIFSLDTRTTQAQLTHITSSEWTNNIIQRTLRDRSPFERERDRAIEKTFTAEWSGKSGMSGRRVVIKGLPGSVKVEDVKRLGKDCGVVQDAEGCVKLPASRQSNVSTYCLTTNSITDAHRLARKLHMKWYKVDVFGQKWLMRAHVHY
ncbi:hypothetical protein I302_101568 [Kwoniella bestiolae CBS 10118]|uniref:Uncharacterized protein n=1 Tax=Kwoniella bestiolae CBS 10118 TaxID=1296100 RepID=A0A1B9GCL0_9TREE|nr:hypothetical protein I302_00251 [Kwoniella bestiolae CBS 10118]OCF28762.1 hypothetical protein I302_00251 [Kwoniella bestiolae CBS 10118]